MRVPDHIRRDLHLRLLLLIGKLGRSLERHPAHADGTHNHIVVVLEVLAAVLASVGFSAAVVSAEDVSAVVALEW